MASANSATTRPRRILRVASPPETLLPPSSPEGRRFRRNIVIAGANPTRIPVRREIANAQASTRRSRLTSFRRARSPGPRARIRRMPATASSVPRRPDIAASVTLSAISCRTIRAATRSKRRSNGQFACAADAARQRQARHVGRGDEEHTQHRACEHPQCQPRPGSDQIQAQGDHTDSPPIGRRQLLVEDACDGAHLRLGLIDGHVRSESPDDEPRTRVARGATGFPIRKHRMRFPHIRIQSESRRENANDLRRTSVKLDGRAYRTVRASETGLPEVDN